jgi:hypothetical protein
MGRTDIFAFPDCLRSTSVPLRGGSILNHSSFQDLSAALTPFQSQVDALVSSFIHQSTDAVALASLAAGGVTYRLGRIGVLSTRIGTGLDPFKRIFSIGTALASEVVAFEMTHRALQQNPNLWKWNGSGGLREGLLHSLITFGTLKGAGRLAQGENLVVQHLLQDSAMVLGHETAGLFGVIPKPQGSLPERFLHAEAVNLQMKAGLSILHGGLPQLESMEKSLDLALNDFRHDGFFPFFPRLQPAYAGGSVSHLPHEESSGRMPEGRDERWDGIYLSEGHSEGGSGSSKIEGGREAFRDRLEKKYGAALGAVYPPILVSDAVTTALDLPSLRAYQGEFLTAFSRLGEKDAVSAHLTLLAIREILIRDALHTSKGSYLDAWVQLFLESALSDGDAGRRSFAFRALHETMKGGLHLAKMEELLERFHYGEDYRISERETSLRRSTIWEDFKKKQKGADFESQRRLSLALVALGDSVFPLIGLRRIDRILETGDHPSKLSEIAAAAEPDSGLSLERFLTAEDPLVLAKKISGTSHTAFVDDIRLALTTVEVLGKAYEYRLWSPFQISKNRKELERRVKEFFQSGEILSPKKLMELVTFQGEERFFQIRRDWEEGRFDLVLLPDRIFDEKVRASNLFASRNMGLFDPGRRREETSQIFIRVLPIEGRDSEEGYQNTFLGLTSRLSALVHEAERFRQMYPSRLSYGLLQLRPFELTSSDRHGRLVSGMMAALEEHLWRLTAGLPRDWELADRAGGVVARIRNEVDARESRE